MERLDDYDDGRRWCGRVSVVEGKERGRELLGGAGPGQGDRRTDRRRKGREEENERGQGRAEYRPIGADCASEGR